MEKRPLYTQQVNAGKVTYFLDIKQTEKGKGFMTITQSRKTEEDKYERSSLVIFEEDIERFGQAFIKTMVNFKKRDREVIIEEARQTHPRAFEPWTKEEDLNLEVLYGEGKELEDISVELQRQKGAIRSRARKLGLIDQPVALA